MTPARVRYDRRVALSIYDMMMEYEKRLTIGMNKLLEKWDEEMFSYWEDVEAEYKVVHWCFALEVLRIRANKPPLYSSLEEVVELLRV